MSTIQTLWNDIHQKYENSQSTNALDQRVIRLLEDDITKNTDDKPKLLDKYCALIEAHPEYFVNRLTLKGDNVRFRNFSVLSDTAVRERTMALIKSSPMWRPLYDLGAFDLIEMLVIGDERDKTYNLDSLSEAHQDILIAISKRMKRIPAGTFIMGAAETNQRGFDQPQHKVTLTKDFWVGQFQVTQALWQSVMGSNPSYCIGPGRPVESVTWFDAVQFCNALSERDGFEPAYKIKGERVKWRHNGNVNGYRLLTEAEWEYCARGNQDFRYAGSNSASEVAWYDTDWAAEVWGPTGDVPHVVGQKDPNGFELYDMSGNVYEWVWDWIGDYSPKDQTNPTGINNAEERGKRGGSADDEPEALEVSSRSGEEPDEDCSSLGFRIARTIL